MTLSDSLINNLTIILVSIITYVVSPYLTEYYKKIFDKTEPKKDEIVQALNVANLISDKVQEIKDYVGADRVIFSQFHNGGNFIHTGQGVKRFSILVEKVTYGVRNLFPEYQGMTISFFHKYFDSIKDNRYTKIDVTNQNSEDYDLGSIFEFHGIKTRYAFAVFTFDDKFTGFLELDFVNSVTTLTEIQVKKILQETGSIGGILTNKLKK